MKRVKLKDICTVVSGATPSRFEPSYWNGNIDWVTPKDIGKPGMKYIEAAPERITEEGFRACSTQMLPPNSLLFSSRAPIGHIAINRNPVCTNQGFKSLIPHEGKVDTEFLYYCLGYFKEQIAELGTGSTFKEISKRIFEDFEIPLPPLAEQKRIAALLDAADALRQQDKALIAHYNQLAQSVFLEMFGAIDSKTKGAGWKTLREVSIRMSDGPFGSNLKSEHYAVSGVRVIRLQNIGVNEFVGDDCVYVKDSHYEAVLKKFTCFTGDIVIATMGNPNIRACIIPQNIEKAINKADCILLRANERIVNSQYVASLINQPSFLASASEHFHGQTRIRISMGQLSQILIPVPPLALQTQFAQIIENIEQQKQQAEAGLVESEALFQSLLQASFVG